MALLSRLLNPSPIPFCARADTPLIQLGSRDTWCLRDAFEGTQIFGGTGSGKTSGSGRAIAHAFLRAGMGGLVLCAKVDEAAHWRKLAEETGRASSIIELDASGDRRFNFIDYAQAIVGGHGFDYNLVNMFAYIAEAFSSNTQGGGSENAFFREAALEMLAHSFPFLRTAYGTIRLADFIKFLNSAPKTPEELESEEWHASSFCAETMFRALENAASGSDLAYDLEQHGSYWTEYHPYLGDKTRSSIVVTLTTIMHPFLTGAMHRIFCTSTTVVPDITHEGAILIVNLPVKSFGKLGAVAQQIVKYLWQVSTEQRRVSDATRPVFLWADECQNFMNSYDSEYMATARSSRACTVFITQDKPSYEATIKGENAKAVAASLLGKFQTRIFHSNMDKETNEYAAEMLGKVARFHRNRSYTTGSSENRGGNLAERGDATTAGGGGRSAGTQQGYSEYRDYDVPPDYFSRHLRIGGRENKFLVDAIFVRNGRLFKEGGRNRLKVTFSQK